jgi:hypothetical protein
MAYKGDYQGFLHLFLLHVLGRLLNLAFESLAINRAEAGE